MLTAKSLYYQEMVVVVDMQLRLWPTLSKIVLEHVLQTNGRTMSIAIKRCATLEELNWQGHWLCPLFLHTTFSCTCKAEFFISIRHITSFARRKFLKLRWNLMPLKKVFDRSHISDYNRSAAVKPSPQKSHRKSSTTLKSSNRRSQIVNAIKNTTKSPCV